MLTPKSYKIGYEIHHRASFCELHPNQHVEISLLKLLRFQPALLTKYQCQSCILSSATQTIKIAVLCSVCAECY